MAIIGTNQELAARGIAVWGSPMFGSVQQQQLTTDLNKQLDVGAGKALPPAPVEMPPSLDAIRPQAVELLSDRDQRAKEERDRVQVANDALNQKAADLQSVAATLEEQQRSLSVARRSLAEVSVTGDQAPQQLATSDDVTVPAAGTTTPAATAGDALDSPPLPAGSGVVIVIVLLGLAYWFWR